MKWLVLFGIVHYAGTGLAVEPRGVEPKFSSIYQLIIAPRCIECHDEQTSYVSVIKNWVMPGFPQNSPFWTRVESDEMPDGGARLTAEEKTAIRDWIRLGALDD